MMNFTEEAQRSQSFPSELFLCASVVESLNDVPAGFLQTHSLNTIASSRVNPGWSPTF